MYFKEDAWMMKRIFQLSDRALIRMVNHLFCTEYSDEESVWKEWQEKDVTSVCLKMGGMNRYEFRLRRLDGCIQICAEDRGCVFYHGKTDMSPVIQVREPRILYFGEGSQEQYSATLEFPGHERVSLPIRMVTLKGYSAQKLEERGLILFLPFLFQRFVQELKEERKEDMLKYFLIHDIVGALSKSYQKGNLTAFDMQRLKQLCRQAVWKSLACEKWMQNLEMQELVLNALEADLDFLERACRPVGTE